LPADYCVEPEQHCCALVPLPLVCSLLLRFVGPVMLMGQLELIIGSRYDIKAACC
jgi:hypothetical protein